MIDVISGRMAAMVMLIMGMAAVLIMMLAKVITLADVMLGMATMVN